ncbi:MAG: peptidoglycan-binding protein [Cytophagales bacterium]|nr:MAG: peptidoglycan-binding protein [Cytophagales bacterium]TAF59904.1 MAG: peptidoglycan-binding protein [Cytophagales bacterium]
MARLEKGKKGRAVTKLQKLLNQVGYTLPENGVFDDMVANAVRDFQKQNNLPEDGEVDRDTKMMLKRMRKEVKRDTNLMPLPELTPLGLEAALDEPEFDEEFTLQPLSAKDLDLFASKKFKTLAEAKGQYQLLEGMDLPAAKRASVLAVFRKKALTDVYGEAPSVADVEKLRDIIFIEKWLLPEGNDVLMYYMTDSPNYFKGGHQRGKDYYGYTVMRKPNSDVYDLRVHAVRNNASFLVFVSTINIVKTATAFQADVFLGKYDGTRWTVDKASALKASLENGKTSITYAATGGFAPLKDSTHGMGAAQLTACEDKGFSAKNVIKTALKALIMEYHKTMR